jgi:hypothetical protein
MRFIAIFESDPAVGQLVDTGLAANYYAQPE